MQQTRKTVGEYLVENRLLSVAQLQTARLESEKTGESLSHVLIRLGLVPEERILEYYTDHCLIPTGDVKKLDPQVLPLIPEATAKRYHLLPLARKDNRLIMALSDPLNVIVLDEIKFRTGLEIEVRVARESEIAQAIAQYYGAQGSVGELIKNIDLRSVAVGDEDLDLSKLQSLAEEAPIIKLLNTFITQAFHDRASDLHIEPDENILRVRHRIDGVLYDVATLPKYLQPAIISRAKIMAEMNIAVKRAPQDGRFQIDIEGNPIDVRVSSFPTIYGENIVMRLLDTRSILLGLDEVGFSPEDLARFNSLLKYPNGIILVTGPTGCGKTTTLYSALNTLNSPKKNIMTIEDPVEYHLFGIRQAQINVKAGLTFATGLRSILRQDPDIIMVGEIRDLETAEIAVQAALTGHLVLSTLHTNDAPSALTRLVDMGVEPFLIASSVIGIVAQRLVRTICKECKTSFHPAPPVLEELHADLRGQDVAFFAGKGCKACKETGYRGRTGIIELLAMNEPIKELIIAKASAGAILKAAEAAGMRSMRTAGITKALAGITTIDEVLQVTRVE
ncbi:MAG: Flp pilus assembly complex ATPase component TadA [Candidatus Margulisbacteria bacterium]|jgi:type IV pilus assembly protein PilB|nr:Flp pilus assembly complex ATPase component TadA [Candidatus Margulisiibacteriota bacterium]